MMDDNSGNTSNSENKSDQQAQGNAAEDSGHWQSLAELLGADPAQPTAPSTEAPPKETKSESPKQEARKPAPPRAKSKEPSRRPKTESAPPKSNWQSLAGMLGIGGASGQDDAGESSAAQEESPSKPRPAKEPHLRRASNPNPPESASQQDRDSLDSKQSATTSKRGGRRSFWGRKSKAKSDDTVSGAAAEPTCSERQSERPAASSGSGSESAFGQGIMEGFQPDEVDKRKAKSQDVLATLFVPGEATSDKKPDDDSSGRPRIVDDVTPLDGPDSDGPMDSVDTPEDLPNEGRSGYRGRRRQRRSRSGRSRETVSNAPPQRSGSPEARESAERTETPRAEQSERTSRGARRERGGRGGREERSPRGATRPADSSVRPQQPAPSDSSATGEAIGEVAADESSERNPRGKRRRRRRRTGSSDARPRQESAPVDDADVIDEPQGNRTDSVIRLEASADLFDAPDDVATDFEDDDMDNTVRDASNRRKSSIPSWQEAVSVLVERNISSRSSSDRSKSGGSRRRRSGRRNSSRPKPSP